MKKTVLSALVLAGISVSASAAFADSNAMAPSDQGPVQYGSGGEMRQWMQWREKNDKAFLDQYLRADLSDTEKSTLNALLQADRGSMKTLADSLKAGTVTQADFQVQAKALRETHITNVLPYVATDKQDAFRTAMEAKPLLPPRDGGQDGDRKWRGQNRQQGPETQSETTAPANSVETPSGTAVRNNANIHSQTKLLPASITTALDSKLATFSADSDKLAWLNAVVAKVDTLSASSKSVKTKRLLNELKDLLNERIDTLNGTNVDASTLGNLFQ